LFDTVAANDYKGYIGLDIGGQESEMENLDDAFASTVAWLGKEWIGRTNFQIL